MSPDTLAMASNLCALYGLTTPEAKRALHALLLAAERDGTDSARRAVARHGRGEAQDSGEVVTSMRFGRSKGVPLREIEDRDLAWYARVLAENVADESKARFVADNQRSLDAVKAEMARRGAQ